MRLGSRRSVHGISLLAPQRGTPLGLLAGLHLLGKPRDLALHAPHYSPRARMGPRREEEGTGDRGWSSAKGPG